MAKIEKSKKEKQLLARAKELPYVTDRLGPGSLMTQVSHINASRLIMLNHQLTHMVSIKDPEQPLVPTGFENKLAEYNSMLNKSDADYKVVAKFEKNMYNYVIIGFDEKNRRYHAWQRVELEEHSEGFSTRYNNKYLDSLDIGDVIEEGTYVQKSTNYDKNMNFCYGKNVNTVYLVSPYIYEDGILVMNGAENMFNTFRSHTIEINLADNEILLNWYGDDDHYQGLPLVGEKTRKGFVAIVRRIENSKAPYSLKKKKLQHIDRDDRKYYASGKVIDIEVHTNKDPDKMIDVGATHTIMEIYRAQQEYYKKLYKYMINIVDNADDGNYTYSDEFSLYCAQAKDYIDSSAYFTDSNDNVFGSTKIIIHLMEEEKMVVGSKLVGRSGNKGVISRIIPPEESWHMEDGTPIHFVVAALGIVGRLNQSQMNEHSINELSETVVRKMKDENDIDKKFKIAYDYMKMLNADEADEFKKWYKNLSDDAKGKFIKRIERDGITIIQDPIDNANIMDIAKVYDKYEPKWQHIIYEDGQKSLKKLLCAKAFFFRLKQDPLDKYAARSRGPVNPLTTLPAKSNLKKNYQAPFSDVAVRFGEMEQEVLLTMINHPSAVADFMMENSTSYPMKEAISEQAYLGDPEEDINVEDVEVTSKKNAQWIAAYLNVLGTEIVIDTEKAPPGEYFED